MRRTIRRRSIATWRTISLHSPDAEIGRGTHLDKSLYLDGPSDADA